MRNILVLAFVFAVMNGSAQSLVKLGDNVFNLKLISNTHFEMSYSVMSGRQPSTIGSFDVDIAVNGKTLSVFTKINLLNGNSIWTDTSVSDVVSLFPIYRSSDNSSRQYHFRYGNTIEGYYLDKKTGKGSQILESGKGIYFDSYLYPYLLGTLPLTSGYKATLPVYEYNPGSKSRISDVRITEVKSNMHKSEISGEHAVWQVSVWEEGTDIKYEYYLDKESRKLWKAEILANGSRFLLVDKEVDYSPFTAKFEKEATYKMITEGTATISGQVFARDNENTTKKGIAILNINKKQYAQQGTTVILIPYTDYFREWIKWNEKVRKKGQALPLSPEAAGCIKVTSVYDNDGNFEFTNLKPGDYYLFTEFGYVHNFSRTEVIGYTDTYINGLFQGTTANTQVNRYKTGATATIKKIVTISREGEKVMVKLKKTL